jgi:SHS2 domain-containing protein
MQRPGYRFKEHTADIAITAEGRTLEELFTFFAEGYREVSIDGKCGDEKDRKTISLTADELDELLVDFLSELNYLTLVNKWIFCDIKDMQIVEQDEYKLTAVIEGEPYKEGQYEFKVEIKAVTYHQLNIVRTDQGYLATVVFDI